MASFFVDRGTMAQYWWSVERVGRVRAVIVATAEAVAQCNRLTISRRPPLPSFLSADLSPRMGDSRGSRTTESLG